jgi:hypothetical protein
MKTLLCFLIPLLGAVKINFVGELTAGELLLFILFPFQLGEIRRLLNLPIVVNTFALGALSNAS